MANGPDNEEAFLNWLDMYHDRLTSVTGVVIDTWDSCSASDEHHEILWRLYRSGADAVEAADEELKNWPPEQRANNQSAEEFRKEWHEAKAGAGEFLDAHPKHR